MHTRKNYVIETLTSIVDSAIEYDLHNEPNRFINFIDLYRAFLHSSHNDEQESDLVTTRVTFQQFIFDQTLLDAAASMATVETGERVDAPTALTIQSV